MGGGKPLMFDNLFANLAGKWIATKAGIKEASMDTKWYQNKSTLAHLFAAIVTGVTAGVGIYTGDFGGHVPDSLLKITSLILVLAHGVGIYDNHS